MSDAWFKIDGYTEMLRALKKLAPEVDKEVRKEIRKVANAAASDAKGRAAAIPSERIPGAIGVSVTNKGVGIRVNRKKAPHGSLFELGSKAGGGRSRRFVGAGHIRHPVFARSDDPAEWTWVTQPIHPFLRPAIEAHEAEMNTHINSALLVAARKAGWDRA